MKQIENNDFITFRLKFFWWTICDKVYDKR